MGSAERREREREEMKTLILETAMRLFLDEGYEKVSMRRIADEIEYSPGTIYLYFRDKDEIMYALHRIAFSKFNKALAGMGADGSPDQRLVAGGRGYVEFALANPELYELMFIMRAPVRCVPEKAAWEEGEQSYGMLRNAVQAAVDSGYLPEGTDVDAATLYFWSTVHGLASLAIRGRLNMLGDDEHVAGMIHRALAVMTSQIPDKE